MGEAPATPDEVRELIRTCAVAVKPGEVLVVRVSEDWSPSQLREAQYALNWGHEIGEPIWPFRVLIVPGQELGVAETRDERATP